MQKIIDKNSQLVEDYKKDIKKWIQHGHIISLTREQRYDEMFQYERVTNILERTNLNVDSFVFICATCLFRY